MCANADRWYRRAQDMAVSSRGSKTLEYQVWPSASRKLDRKLFGSVGHETVELAALHDPRALQAQERVRWSQMQEVHVALLSLAPPLKGGMHFFWGWWGR